MIYRLSPSNLSLLKDCPRCFWIHFNKGIKRPEGIFPSLPGGMDTILKHHFDYFMDKGEMPPELKHLEGEYNLFNNIQLLKIWRNNFQGIRWQDEMGNILTGAIDNLLQKDNKLIVLDYKTRGFPLKENSADYYQNQMDIYNFLLRKNGYETEDYSYLLFYYPRHVDRNGSVVFNTELVRKNVDVENAERIFSKAVKMLNEKIPDCSDSCKYCGYIDSLQLNCPDVTQLD